ncbi:cytochrome P450 89A2-like [Oryza glaberrima]|uniref:cytochrome P450 89A2-like n=1 Tax=Oryza glaberrima TaxID=4538 RepID=UPI00224C53BB|nr:cytochrome P450 89A2-like [Oryza glaberrima]
MKLLRGLPSGHSPPPQQQAAVEALVVDIAARVGGGSGSDGEVLVRDVVHDALFPVAAWFCFGDGIGECDVRDLQRVLREFELDVVVEGFGGSMLANLVHWWRLRRFVASGRRQAEVFLPLISQRRRTQHRGEHKFRPYVDSLLDLRVPVGDNAAAGEGKEEHRLSHRALTDDEMVGLVSEFLGSGTESAVSNTFPCRAAACGCTSSSGTSGGTARRGQIRTSSGRTGSWPVARRRG